MAQAAFAPARRRFLLLGAGARVGAACLALQGVTCRACVDRCEPRAIRFEPLPGGRAAASVDPACCNSCGECVPACPAGAITV